MTLEPIESNNSSNHHSSGATSSSTDSNHRRSGTMDDGAPIQQPFGPAIPLVVNQDDIDEVLASFQVRYKDKRLVNGMEQRSMGLIARDCPSGSFLVLTNDAGELCTTYPSKIVIPLIPPPSPTNTNGTQPQVPTLDPIRLKELTRRAARARCRGRFPAPVIAINGKYICRSATLSTGVEIYGRSFLGQRSETSDTYDGPEQQPQQSSNLSEFSNMASNMVSQVVSGGNDFGGGLSGASADLCSRARSADIALLKYLNVGHIGDLMVEKKKIKYGVYVTSSEKVDKESRYSEFSIFSLPYPGCEFFAKLRENDYNAERLHYDWNNVINDAELSMPDEELARDSARRLSLSSPWAHYRRWDIITLTRNYLRLLLLYTAESPNGFLVHCISGWDRTPLFISLLRLSLWADGKIHEDLSPLEMVYLTLTYDWFLFGHDLTDRLKRGEEILFFCFYFLKYISGEEFVYPDGKVDEVHSSEESNRTSAPLIDFSNGESVPSKIANGSSSGFSSNPLSSPNSFFSQNPLTSQQSAAATSHPAVSPVGAYQSNSAPGRVRKPSFRIGDFHLEDSLDEYGASAATIAAASGLLGSSSSLSSLSSISSLRSNGASTGAEATPPRYFPTCGAQHIAALNASSSSPRPTAAAAASTSSRMGTDEMDGSFLVDFSTAKISNSGYESATTLTGSPSSSVTNPVAIPSSSQASAAASASSPSDSVHRIPALCRSDSWQIVTETGSFAPDPLPSLRLLEVRGGGGVTASSIASSSSNESPRPSARNGRTASVGSDFRLSPKSRSSLSSSAFESLSIGSGSESMTAGSNHHQRHKNVSGTGTSFTSIPEAVTPPPTGCCISALERRKERLQEARNIFYKSYASVVGFRPKNGGGLTDLTRPNNGYPSGGGSSTSASGGSRPRVAACPPGGGSDPVVRVSYRNSSTTPQTQHDTTAANGTNGSNGGGAVSSAAAMGIGWLAATMSGATTSTTATASAAVNRTAAATE